MSFLDLAKKRQSCRKYAEKTVEHEKIERCLEAARLSPSACNSQPWNFIIIDDPELKQKVAEATFNKVIGFNHFSVKAPVLVLVLSNPGSLRSFVGSQLQGTTYRLIDIGISVEHFCLQATEEGLGTCIMGYFNKKKIKRILNIPKNNTVDMIITLGYPHEDNEQREKLRRNLEDIYKYNND